MSKILISFLGTGAVNQTRNPLREYKKAAYSINGEIIGESSFVASILFDYFKFDGLYLIGTTKSMWEEAYRYFAEKTDHQIDEDSYFQLAYNVEKANHLTNQDTIDLSVFNELLDSNLKALCIPYGLTRDEQLAIFSMIGDLLSNLKPNDEVILDVTHSFRSLPLFVTSVINYFKSLLKEIKFEKVYYGMLDVMSEFDNVAPIIDISTSIEMQNWTTAAYSFKEYGKGKLLTELLGEEGKIVKTFSDAVNINYLNEIKTKLVDFRKKGIHGFENEFANRVVPGVFKSFTDRLYKATKQQSLFQLELSCWHTEKENYSSAYIVLLESIVTFACEQSDINWKDKDRREEAKKMLIDNNYEPGLKEIFINTNSRRINIAHNIQGKTHLMEEDIKYLKKTQKIFKSVINKANHV